MTLQSPMAAFEAALPAERARLLRYFKRRVGRDAAPDLMQEAFARLYGCERLATLECPQAYLTRIARNLLIDRARQKKRGCPIVFPLDEDRDAASRADQTWRIEAMDLQRLYRRTVRAMPSKTRRVFLMHRLRKLTYKQIAERVGISIATVEYHMMRALSLCRAAIAEQW